MFLRLEIFLGSTGNKDEQLNNNRSFVRIFLFYQALLYFLFCLQGSQGYGSTESDFVDMDGFQSMQDTTSLPELNLVGQVRIISD